MGRRWRPFPVAALMLAFLIRCVILHQTGEIKYLSYGTIIGRIDQFLMGIIIWTYRGELLSRKFMLSATMFAYLIFQWWFNARGGAFRSPPGIETQRFWLVMPLAEARAFGAFVVWFDQSDWSCNNLPQRMLAKVGEYSYSIYLLHAFAVYKASNFVDEHVMRLDNVYVACFWSLIFIIGLLPVGYLSYRFIEEPFLRFRKKYTY